MEWKRKHIAATLMSGFFPEIEPENIGDFSLPDHIIREHEIISGYIEIQQSLASIRECEFYFRKYPFSNKNISREAHLRTCCELFFGRIYQFRERFFKQLKKVQRRNRKNLLNSEILFEEFERRFKPATDARNDLSHHKAYQDIHLNAVGLGDLLSFADPELVFLKVPRRSYQSISRYWVQQVKAAADELDVFIGVLAIVMLTLCTFLPDPDSEQDAKARLQKTPAQG